MKIDTNDLIKRAELLEQQASALRIAATQIEQAASGTPTGTNGTHAAKRSYHKRKLSEIQPSRSPRFSPPKEIIEGIRAQFAENPEVRIMTVRALRRALRKRGLRVHSSRSVGQILRFHRDEFDSNPERHQWGLKGAFSEAPANA